MNEGILDGIGRVTIALFVLVAGAASTVFTGRAFLQGLALRAWEGHECAVIDLEVVELSESGKVWNRGRYEVLFYLRETTTGAEFRGMPATAPAPRYHDEYELQREIVRAAPGAVVDCWVNPAGTLAYVRRPTGFVVMIMFGMTAFSVLLLLGGVVVLRPGLLDRAGEAIQQAFRNLRERGR